MQEHVAFAELLEMRPLDYRKGHARFELIVGEKHLRTLGIAHGGVAAALLDTALGVAAATTAPEGYDVVTAQLNVNFIRPAWMGERLIASGDVQHAGKMTAVCRGELRTQEGALVGAASGTFLYLPHPKTPGEPLIQRADHVERFDGK
jgi:uncharacterized protein (TIGR00369 family)